MTIYPLANGQMYYAMQRNPITGGGFIGKGSTHAEALMNCLRAIHHYYHAVNLPCHEADQ